MMPRYFFLIAALVHFCSGANALSVECGPHAKPTKELREGITFHDELISLPTSVDGEYFNFAEMVIGSAGKEILSLELKVGEPRNGRFEVPIYVWNKGYRFTIKAHYGRGTCDGGMIITQTFET